MNKYFSLLFASFFLITTQCNEKKKKEFKTNTNELETTRNYSMVDFKKVPKIDTHIHINSEGKTIIKFARANNFKLLSISVDYSGYPPIREQQIIKRNHLKDDPDIIAFSTVISLEGWNDPNWSTKAIQQLKKDFELGANSVKTWKNIGMEARDKDGNLIVLDDPKFDPILNFIKDQGKVLISHAGEPRNCWLPLDSMTVNNDREYYSKNPKYHMYLHPEMPSYEEQIKHRDNMLAKNPDLPFIGAHMASLEWSVDEIANFLDRFPNANIDLAERISHLQYQSHRNYKKVRDFIIKYQDRILYGTDFEENTESTPKTLEEHMMKIWLKEWEYFNTDNIVTVPQLDTPVKGLKLPKEVVDKLYRLNAERLFPNAWK